MKRVLVTGGRGFLGRHAIDSLIAAGWDVVVAGRTRGSAGSFVELDLLELDQIVPVLRDVKASHLLHLAWYTEHGLFWQSPLNLRWVEATVRLVEAFCSSGGEHVAVAGTCAEYDWTYGYCREDATPLGPATLYGVAKDAARRLVATVCEQAQVSCAWGRVFVPYGPGDSSSRLILSMLAALRAERNPFAVNLSLYRDFLHVSDVASAFTTLVQSHESGAFNVSSGAPVLLRDVLVHLAEVLHVDPRPMLALNVARPLEAPLVVGDNHKLRALGWTPNVNWKDGMRDVATAGAV